MPGGAEPPRDGTPRKVWVEADGPVLVEGPVEIHARGEEPVVVDRFMVAICMCRRSRAYPLCDSTHRDAAHRRGAAAAT